MTPTPARLLPTDKFFDEIWEDYCKQRLDLETAEFVRESALRLGLIRAEVYSIAIHGEQFAEEWESEEGDTIYLKNARPTVTEPVGDWVVEKENDTTLRVGPKGKPVCWLAASDYLAASMICEAHNATLTTPPEGATQNMKRIKTALETAKLFVLKHPNDLMAVPVIRVIDEAMVLATHGEKGGA